MFIMTTVTSVDKQAIGRTNAPRTLVAHMAAMDGAGPVDGDKGEEDVAVEEVEESML